MQQQRQTEAKTVKPPEILERSFQFALSVVRLCHSLDPNSGVTRILSHQLLRSATSIGANVEEAQAGQSRSDFVSKYAIALKEAREATYWLRLLEETTKTPDGRCLMLLTEGRELANILGSVIVKMKSPRS